MTIIRAAHDKDHPYTQISNAVLNDRRLSLKARGLIAYLLTLPDNWNINVKELLIHFPDKRRSVDAAIHELRELGYITVSTKQRYGGKFGGVEYTIHEEPYRQNSNAVNNESKREGQGKSQFEPHCENSNADSKLSSPHRHLPYTEKRHLINNNNNNILNTDTVNVDRYARVTQPVDNFPDSVSESTSFEKKSNLIETAKQPKKYQSSISSFLKSYEKGNNKREQLIEKVEQEELKKKEIDNSGLRWKDLYAVIEQTKKQETHAPRSARMATLGHALNKVTKQYGINSEAPPPDNAKYQLKMKISHSDIPTECKEILHKLADQNLELAKKFERWRFIQTNFGQWGIELSAFELDFFANKYLTYFNQVGLCLLKKGDDQEG